jgi:hypothetical protein
VGDEKLFVRTREDNDLDAAILFELTNLSARMNP